MRTKIEVPARLDRRFGLAPLAVLVAPAGFGKTTLLRSWQCRAGGTPMGFVSFDAFHRSNALDAGRALAAGIAAVDVAQEVAQDLTALIPADGESFGADFVQSVGNALRSLPHRFALFLDNVHALAPATARDLGRLVSIAADDHHRFVVATRSEPPWPTHRWRVAGFADLPTAEDLRLTDDEIADVLGPELAAVAPRVTAATRGWPAALEAVRWRLQVDPSVEIEEAVLDLVDYVAAEVLPALGNSDVQVLSRTSILEPFPATVAAVVSGDATAPSVLDETARRTSLVTRLADGRFEYHPVLREALRRRLSELDAGTEPELHARAADAWLDEPDSFAALANAINHLIEARSWERALARVYRADFANTRPICGIVPISV